MTSEIKKTRDIPSPVLCGILGISHQELSRIKTRTAFDGGHKRQYSRALFYSEFDALKIQLTVQLNKFSIDLTNCFDIANWLVDAVDIDTEDRSTRVGIVKASEDGFKTSVVFDVDRILEILDESCVIATDLIGYRDLTLTKLRDGIEKYLQSDEVFEDDK